MKKLIKNLDGYELGLTNIGDDNRIDLSEPLDTPDYIVFKGDDGLTYAKEGHTGKVIFPGDTYANIVNKLIQEMDSGLIKVVGEFDQDDTITMKGGITLDLSEAAITLTQNVPGYRLKPNCKIYGGDITVGVASYSSAVFYANGVDHFEREGHETVLENIKMSNSENSGAGILFYVAKNGDIVANIKVRNISISGFYEGIILNAVTPPVNLLGGTQKAYILDNMFDNIYLYNSSYGLDLIRGSTLGAASYCNNNIFLNVKYYNAGSATEAIHVEGQYNMIFAMIINIGSAIGINLTSEANNTYVVHNLPIANIKNVNSSNVVISIGADNGFISDVKIHPTIIPDSTTTMAPSKAIQLYSKFYNGTSVVTTQFNINNNVDSTGAASLLIRNATAGTNMLNIGADGTTTFYNNILPNADGTIDIGSATLHFKDIYASGTVNAANVAATAGITSGGDVSVTGSVTTTGNVTAPAGIITHTDVGDYGGSLSTYTPPTGQEGMVILAYDTNLGTTGVPTIALYAYINGGWHSVRLT